MDVNRRSELPRLRRKEGGRDSVMPCPDTGPPFPSRRSRGPFGLDAHFLELLRAPLVVAARRDGNCRTGREPVFCSRRCPKPARTNSIMWSAIEPDQHPLRGHCAPYLPVCCACQSIGKGFSRRASVARCGPPLTMHSTLAGASRVRRCRTASAGWAGGLSLGAPKVIATATTSIDAAREKRSRLGVSSLGGWS